LFPVKTAVAFFLVRESRANVQRVRSKSRVFDFILFPSNTIKNIYVKSQYTQESFGKKTLCLSEKGTPFWQAKKKKEAEEKDTNF
jgi:hypothetical protein